ncbi:hypothetical protein [Methylobacterium sp. Gmos1]
MSMTGVVGSSLQRGAADIRARGPADSLTASGGTPLYEKLGYFLYDAVRELLGAEAVELDLDLGELSLDADVLGLIGFGPGVQRVVPGMRIL